MEQGWSNTHKNTIAIHGVEGIRLSLDILIAVCSSWRAADEIHVALAISFEIAYQSGCIEIIFHIVYYMFRF